jgi:hypothetical protein
MLQAVELPSSITHLNTCNAAAAAPTEKNSQTQDFTNPTKKTCFMRFLPRILIIIHFSIHLCNKKLMVESKLCRPSVS